MTDPSDDNLTFFREDTPWDFLTQVIGGTLLALAIVLFVLATPGCCGSGAIKASEIDGTLRRVIERHDAYTKNDKELSPFQRKLNLRDGEVLLKVLDAAKPADVSEEDT